VFDLVAKKFTGGIEIIMVNEADNSKLIHVVGSFPVNLL
jgi:hypothetical protein